MNSELLEQIRKEILPPTVPPVILQLIRLLGQEQGSVSELTEIVHRDPALSARLLGMANSAAYARPFQVSTLSHALALLGLRTVWMVALSATLVESVQQKRIPGFAYMRFWRDSVISGLAARDLATLTGRIPPEEALVAGLLQDVGVHGLAIGVGGKYLKLLEQARTGSVPLATLERAAYDLDHAEVSASLFDALRFPPHLAGAVRAHVETPAEEPASHALASYLHIAEHARRALSPEGGPPTIVHFGPLAQRVLGVSQAQSRQLLERIQVGFREMAAKLALPMRLFHPHAGGDDFPPGIVETIAAESTVMARSIA